MHRQQARGPLVVAMLLALASCSGSGSTTPTTTGQPSATSTTSRPEDGVLLIGAIVPRGGSVADIGTALDNALSLGLREINAAGGVNGNDVRLISRSEGENPASTERTIQDLVQLGVDAIIGPTSSTITLATLGAMVSAGVLSCSPTATALALDGFPDDGLFFRTIASDSLQAQAVAATVESSGTSSAVLVYLDDDYGRPFAEAARAALIAQGTTVSAAVGFRDSPESISAAVDAVQTSKSDVVAVIADDITGPAVINAIDAAADEPLTYVVNDAIRRPAASAEPFGTDLAARVFGVAPLAYTTSKPFNDALLALDRSATGPYAHNAYDCLSVIALAAQATGSDQPAVIAGSITAVTTSGSGCATFTACMTELEQGHNIDYDGPTGNLSIAANGNVATADFERFTFDESGRAVSLGTITADDG